jgi:hypothetical protein
VYRKKSQARKSSEPVIDEDIDNEIVGTSELHDPGQQPNFENQNLDDQQIDGQEMVEEEQLNDEQQINHEQQMMIYNNSDEDSFMD